MADLTLEQVQAQLDNAYERLIAAQDKQDESLNLREIAERKARAMERRVEQAEAEVELAEAEAQKTVCRMKRKILRMYETKDILQRAIETERNNFITWEDASNKDLDEMYSGQRAEVTGAAGNREAEKQRADTAEQTAEDAERTAEVAAKRAELAKARAEAAKERAVLLRKVLLGQKTHEYEIRQQTKKYKTGLPQKLI